MKGIIVKASAPTSNDDATKGFYVGFLWLDSSTSILYICADNTLAASIWNIVSTPTSNVWKPPLLDITSVQVFNASYVANNGAGINLSFADAGTNQRLLFNTSLVGSNGIDYDGSDLALKLQWRISQDGVVGDTVIWKVEYAIIKLGDNSNTMVTTLADQNVDVSSESKNIDFSTTVGTMTGVVGGTVLMINLIRKSTSDTFTGNAKITKLELIKS